MDEDLNGLTRDELMAEVRRLRAGIRLHRDSSGQDLCWHHPQLWGLLPERVDPAIAIPPWPQFLRGCVKYRESLDRQVDVTNVRPGNHSTTSAHLTGGGSDSFHP